MFRHNAQTLNVFSRTALQFLLVLVLCRATLAGAAEDTLADLWAASAAAEPRFRAEQLRTEAEGLDVEALRRERRPVWALEAGGDYGQRARPGEERAEGVAARGDILARVEWSLLESGRTMNQRAALLRQIASVEKGEAFNLAFRAEVARIYIAAAIARERHEHLQSAAMPLQHLATTARLRIDSGVESATAREQIDQFVDTWTVQWQAAEQATEQATLKLALLADRETVAPAYVSLQAVPTPREPDATPPAITVLQRQADERRATADAWARSDRWRLDVVGQAGPYLSQAFDDGVEAEYYGGLRVVWQPDLAGVNRRRALAEMRRAEALEQEASALHAGLDRRMAEIAVMLRAFPAQQSAWEDALASTINAERVARLRWEEGVGSWQDWLDEHERLLDVRLRELSWREAMALLWVDYAEALARLDELPSWIGQE